MGKIACQGSGGRLEASGAGCREARAIWSRLDLLEAQFPAISNCRSAGTAPVTGGAPCLGLVTRPGHLPRRAAPPDEGGQGDEWAAYVALDTYSEDVPRDGLRGASPTATECP